MSKQPEALRLADALCRADLGNAVLDQEVAAELRRIHAINAELVEALKKFTEAATFSESTFEFSVMCDRFIDEARATLKKATEQS